MLLTELEQILHQREQIFDSVDAGLFITNAKCEILAVNQIFENVTSIARDEIIGKNVQYMLDKGYISDSICQRVVRERKTITSILRYKNIEKDVIVTGKPVFDEAGELQWVVCTLKDWDLLTKLYKELSKWRVKSEHYKEMFHNLAVQQLEDSEFLAKDQKTVTMLQMAIRIAQGDSSVLLQGESGVGKDMLAKFIHKYSPRAELKGNFVHVNCGAIPENLFEAEFFGYAPGAFTGANKAGKPGLLEIADGGTVYLDEIAELPLFMQAKLLKVLQDKTITRVGDTHEKHVDIKIIAATNKDLKKLVERKEFREDLYFRLNVFPIHIPGLRDRKNDILPLVAVFLEKFNAKYRQKKYFETNVLQIMQNYQWPGNIRELENTIEQLVVLCPDDQIETRHLPDNISKSFMVGEAVRLSETNTLKSIIEGVEKAVIVSAVNQTETLQETADKLGLDISTLTRKKQKYGIFKKDRSSA